MAVNEEEGEQQKWGVMKRQKEKARESLYTPPLNPLTPGGVVWGC